MAANSLSKFGGSLFIAIQLTNVACNAAGPLKVRLPFRSQNVPPPPPKPLHKNRDICRHLVTAHFSWLTYSFLTQRALIIARSFVHCGLKYQHCPMKQKLFLDQKGCQWCTVPHIYQRNVMLKNRRYSKYRCLQLQEGPQTCLL